ncbi:hypothetical protein ACOSQ2_025504 [Xanthoceras sorbifolium]
MQLVSELELDITSPYNLFLIFLLFLLPIILLLKKHVKNDKLNLPPSLPKLPIIGNLHPLGRLPYRSLRVLSNKYGPLMLLHLGNSSTLVTRDVVFSNQPKSTTTNILRYDCEDIGFAPCSVDLTEMIQPFINNIVSRCVLGRRTEDENGRSKFGELARRLMVPFTTFYFGDMFPCLGWIDVLTGHIGHLNATFRALYAFFDQVIEKHRIS